MKNNKQNIFKALILLIIMSVGLMFQACEEYPHEYEITDGVPSVNYIRMTNPDLSDSLIVAASLDVTITLMGDNLTSITEMWFNDKKAYLNTSFITPSALIVTIPNEIPGVVSDKIYLVAGNDTITHDFNVVVPPPAPRSMLCEFVADGDIAVIRGNYFINDPNVPLQVLFPGEVAGEVISVSDKFDMVSVKVPAGAGVGPLTVKSIYGSSRSSFYFRDDRNYILDWDNLDAAGGWRSGVIANSNPEGVNGNYVRFQGDMSGEIGATWNEDAFSFNLWNASNGRPDEPYYNGDLSKALLKFECYVVEEWKSAALQMIFTPYGLNNTNSYLGDPSVPRGLWMPWVSTGSYKTDSWTTVTIPMSEFHYTNDGSNIDPVTKDMLGGLTFFLWHGGVAGEDGRINMCIDNIRIVPM